MPGQQLDISKGISKILAASCSRTRKSRIIYAETAVSELTRKADQYWRSRTINEAQLQGYTSLRLTCGCGRITDYPFTLLLQRQGVTRHNFIGNIRFRCKNCGGKDVAIGVRFPASQA